jgi:hypothetical protein
MYLENSIKSLERKRRGCSEKLIVIGENTKKPPDRKTFLANDENKKQLIELLCRVWSTDNFAPKLLSKNVITVSDGPFILQVMMVPAYVAQKLYQLNRHRKKLIHELFFTVSMENNKDTELLEFVVRIPIYSLSSFTTRWNYKE